MARSLTTRQQSRKARLRLDPLEPREMPAALPTASLGLDGVLRVAGTDADDLIDIRKDNGSLSVAGAQVQTPAGPSGSVPAAQVSRVEVTALGGNDVVRLDLGAEAVTVPAMLDGGAGNDSLTGGAGADTFGVGNDQADRVYAFGPTDRLAFAAPNEVLKSAVSAGGGVVYALYASGDLFADGRLAYARTRDFALDGQNRVLWLGTAGLLQRSRSAYGAGGWDDIATNVSKWVIGANGANYTLGTDGMLRVDGAASWGNTRDFGLDGQNRLLWVGTSGLMQRSGSAYGSGGWDTIATNVTKWVLGANGAVFTVGTDGMLRVNGAASWGNTRDFGLDAQNRLLWLGTAGLLQRSRSAYGSGGWDDIATNVTKFVLAKNGDVYSLSTDAMLRVNGSPSWANTQDFALDQVGRLYWLGTDGNLQRRGFDGSWTLTDSDVESFTLPPVGPPQVVSQLRPASVPVFNDARTAVVYHRTDFKLNPGLWAEDGYRPEHIQHLQSRSGLSTIASALASAAASGLGLRSRIQYLGNFQYRVYLCEPGWQTVYFDGTVYDTDLVPAVSKVSVQGGVQVKRLADFWPLLFARAYLQYQAHVDWHSDPGPDSGWYQGFLGLSASWRSPKNANFAVAGGVKNNWDTTEDIAVQNLQRNLQLGSICTVRATARTLGGTSQQWAVLGLWQDSFGGWTVRLYNPWGWDSADGALYDMEDGKVKMQDDGFVTLTWAQFATYFDTITCVTRNGVAYP